MAVWVYEIKQNVPCPHFQKMECPLNQLGQFKLNSYEPDKDKEAETFIMLKFLALTKRACMPKFKEKI